MRKITGALDIARLMAMVRGPGVDTRVWISFAEVEGVKVSRDPENAGIFVDLKMLPFGEEYTGWVASPYVGAGVGLYLPLSIGETVLVAVPYGDTGGGITILGRMFAGDALPPEEAIVNGEPSNDIVWVSKEDSSFRFMTQGNGNFVFKMNGSGKMGVGDEPGAAGMEPMALGQQVQGYLNAIESYLNGVVANVLLWSIASATRTNAAVTVPPLLPLVPALSLDSAPVAPNVLSEKGEVK